MLCCGHHGGLWPRWRCCSFGCVSIEAKNKENFRNLLPWVSRSTLAKCSMGNVLHKFLSKVTLLVQDIIRVDARPKKTLALARPLVQ
uniref:Uncharacterized protein n=1 Tax=Cucumis melo TaxID=3656 RepID=A0A9I9EHY5_CUCME